VGIPSGARGTVALLYSIIFVCKLCTWDVASRYDAKVLTAEERAILESAEFRIAIADLWKKQENYLCAVLALCLVFLLYAASVHRHTFVAGGIFFMNDIK
jgi:hypothetical protein